MKPIRLAFVVAIFWLATGLAGCGMTPITIQVALDPRATAAAPIPLPPSTPVTPIATSNTSSLAPGEYYLGGEPFMTNKGLPPGEYYLPGEVFNPILGTLELAPSHESGSQPGEYYLEGEPFDSSVVPTPKPNIVPTPNLEELPLIKGFPNKAVFTEPPTESECKANPKCEVIKATYSYYDPPRGEVNCFDFRAEIPEWAYNYPKADKTHGWCWSDLSAGSREVPVRWEDNWNYAVACADRFPFGTKVYAFGQQWECLDRGGKIICEDGRCWFDFLIPDKHLDYGTKFTVTVIYP